MATWHRGGVAIVVATGVRRHRRCDVATWHSAGVRGRRRRRRHRDVATWRGAGEVIVVVVVMTT